MAWLIGASLVKTRSACFSKNTCFRPHLNISTQFNPSFDLGLKREAQWTSTRDRDIRVFQICFRSCPLKWPGPEVKLVLFQRSDITGYMPSKWLKSKILSLIFFLASQLCLLICNVLSAYLHLPKSSFCSKADLETKLLFPNSRYLYKSFSGGKF